MPGIVVGVVDPDLTGRAGQLPQWAGGALILPVGREPHGCRAPPVVVGADGVPTRCTLPPLPRPSFDYYRRLPQPVDVPPWLTPFPVLDRYLTTTAHIWSQLPVPHLHCTHHAAPSFAHTHSQPCVQRWCGLPRHSVA